MRYDMQWLRDRYEKGDPLKFLFFWGHTNKYDEAVGKFCFSQWYEAPFTVEDVTYRTAEHWMMAQKALLFDNTDIFEKIIAAEKPGEVKELGRQVRNFDEMLWREKRFDIVKRGNFYKFNQHPQLRDYLLNTENRIIVEASPVDAIWGIGLAQDSPRIHDVNSWRGENLLGFALMEVRDILRGNGTQPA